MTRRSTLLASIAVWLVIFVLAPGLALMLILLATAWLRLRFAKEIALFRFRVTVIYLIGITVLMLVASVLNRIF